MVLISFKTAKTKKHIANFRFSYQIQSVVHYVDYLSEDITQGLFMFLASKRLRLPISSERNRPFLRKERETHISSERIRFKPCMNRTRAREFLFLFIIIWLLISCDTGIYAILSCSNNLSTLTPRGRMNLFTSSSSRVLKSRTASLYPPNF